MFEIKFNGLAHSASGSFLPSNPSAIALPFSEKLAQHSPQLTLDFLFEFCTSFDPKLQTGQKIIALNFVQPWLKNLGVFVNPSSSHYEAAGSKLRDCISSIIDLTVKEEHVYPLIQRHIWAEIGRLDSQVVNIVLDELIRAAVDGGIDSGRCEIVADTLISLASVSIRGKIITRLRKVMIFLLADIL